MKYINHYTGIYEYEYMHCCHENSECKSLYTKLIKMSLEVPEQYPLTYLVMRQPIPPPTPAAYT